MLTPVMESAFLIPAIPVMGVAAYTGIIHRCQFQLHGTVCLTAENKVGGAGMEDEEGVESSNDRGGNSKKPVVFCHESLNIMSFNKKINPLGDRTI